MKKIPKDILVILLAIISFIYLLNPDAGVFEIIPDNIPFVGNIDEGFFAFILFSAIEYFRGKEAGWFGKRNAK